MRVTVDAQPFPAFAKYIVRLGRASARSSSRRLSRSTAPDTDDAGKSRIEWGGDQVKDTALAAARPAHRPASSSPATAAPPRPTRRCRCAPATSISASARPSRAATPREGTDTEFDIVARRRRRQADRPTAVEYRSSASTYDYQWYQSRRPLALAESTPTSALVDAGTLALKADAPTRLPSASSTGARIA